MLLQLLQTLFHYSVSIIPAFLLALLISALIAEALPEWAYEKILSKRNFLLVLVASILGALVPICTCGMIPLASKLHKKGTSPLVVFSFLSAGTSSSVTALFITLVLGLGITVGRFLFAVIFGIAVAYIFVLVFKVQSFIVEINNGETDNLVPFQRRVAREFYGLVRGFGPWVLAAIFAGSFIALFVDPAIIRNYAGVSNFFAPFIFSLAAFPFYFCAGSDIPISSALIEKGAGLGNVLAFMTASPSVNLTSFFIFQRWIGFKSSIFYMIVSVLVCGLLGSVINFVMLPLEPL